MGCTTGVNFVAGNSNYCTAVAARATLTGAPNNWNITDGDLDCTPAATDYFITTWQTTTANENITIPIDAAYTYNYTVDWGDGNTTTGETADATHTYTTAGSHTVKISGTFPYIHLANSNDKEKITAINQWGSQVWSTMSASFFSCSNLQGLATDIPNLSNVTDVSYMFSGATVFNQNINSWVVSNVTTMRNMFSDAIAFNQDLSAWDVSNVTTMRSMFSDATAFNQDLSAWNVSNVINMKNMFSDATAFDQNLSSWNVSNTTNMKFMFDGITLSTSSYDSLLTGWAAQTLNPGVDFSGGNSQYCTAVAARAILTGAPNNWNITDGGIAAPVADVAILADITAECSVAMPTAPTAAGCSITAITGTTTTVFPITTQGTTVITWTYDDGNGNTATQMQNVIISLDTTVTQSGTMLTANASGYNYQWVDCNNGNALIAGETNQSFTATTNGSYAVIIDNGTCNLTSSCKGVVTVSISEVTFETSITAYPNPTTGELTIDLGDSYNAITISTLNLFGQKIDVTSYYNQKTINMTINGEKGVYFLQIQSENGEKAMLRVLKN